MIGKITTILARKEAEAYQSQGLHNEARDLYQDLLSASPNMDSGIRETIRSQIADIDTQITSDATRPRRSLTPQEITTIRDGWGDQATEKDTLVCARAFYHISAYSQALEELQKLLLGDGPIKKVVVTLSADCLVRLHPPGDLTAAVTRLTDRMEQPDKIVLAVQLAMARHMEDQGHIEHALALYHHLQQWPGLADGLQSHLDELNQRLQDKSQPFEL